MKTNGFPLDIDSLQQPCICGQSHALSTKEIILEKEALERLPFLLGGSDYPYRTPVVICDTNTWRVAGDRVCRLLAHCPSICLQADHLHADENAVETVLSSLPADADILLAVGAGTIHDITRYVSFQKGIPFFSIPTAASVDGFVSTVAAMTWHGFKKSFSAAAPICVLADSTVFSQAPGRLTASGISDLFGKYTAIADWKIAHAITGETICAKVCQMELEAVEQVQKDLAGIHAGKEESCERLMYGLLLSGLAMQMVGSSRPASGAEHHLSHFWEMEILNPCLDAYHGEKVSVGLVYTLGVYQKAVQKLRTGAFLIPDYSGINRETIHRYFGPKGMEEEILQENQADPLLAISRERIEESLQEILTILEELPAAQEIRDWPAGPDHVSFRKTLSVCEKKAHHDAAFAPVSVCA